MRYLLIIILLTTSLQSQTSKYSTKLDVLILSLTTTSNSAAWSPTKVVKTGQDLTWTASASGMTEQIVITSGTNLPSFDLSVSRSSPYVTITVTSPDGASGFSELTVNSLNINSIDLTNASGISELSCTDNQLTELDVKNNSVLKNLFCHSNQLIDLDISQNDLLSILACFSNQIASLNVGQNIDLTSLSCSNNLLSSLDLSNNDLLESLECDSNNLENLNLKNGNNTIIESIKTTDNTNLFCIQVDDANYSSTNWPNIDPWSSFNEDCTFSPKANDDSYSTLENTALIVDVNEGVLVNDSDPKSRPLIALLETDVSNGILNFNIDGSFTYSPNQDFFGIDSFTYKANNGENDSNIATVTIAVNYVNKPPTANDDTYMASENTVLTVNVSDGVLTNDTDPEGDTLTAVLETNATNGSLTLNADGSFVYTPDTDFSGTDSFTYRANDGELDSNIATVSIEVVAVNEAPIANDNSYITSENIVLNVSESEGVLSNDTDGDGDLLTTVLVSNVGNGNLILEANGSFIYTPDPNFSGLDIFSYKSFDGVNNSNEALVEITVQAGYDLIMPNGFTPNNDNINDRFKPEFKGMQWVQMIIFDTWGNLIYTEEGGSIEGWDGTARGKNMENGNYLYKISGLTNQDEKISLEGLFTLIK